MLFQSAKLKIKRAEKHVDELKEALSKTPLYEYVLETNLVSNERSVGVLRNRTCIEQAALTAGDALHNIRTSLDHLLFELLSPHVESDKHKKIAFPFAKSEKDFRTHWVQTTLKKYNSEIASLLETNLPFNDSIIHLLHQFDIIDKHRVLLPFCDIKTINSSSIQSLVPDFPPNFIDVTISGARKDIVWPYANRSVDIGHIVPPTLFL